ncbi:uncharacterized protein ARMOST_18226 [Armillaria ostoyae]|uniref:Uncharacterized protein n=1 Tax=Armillaria ostoyae TaxID=47428 RepID=A0A284S169_ARMOS|nr:uncharacterized protein ARMOST_18226 [Armillaria ostoyae]
MYFKIIEGTIVLPSTSIPNSACRFSFFLPIERLPSLPSCYLNISAKCDARNLESQSFLALSDPEQRLDCLGCKLPAFLLDLSPTSSSPPNSIILLFTLRQHYKCLKMQFICDIPLLRHLSTRTQQCPGVTVEGIVLDDSTGYVTIP